LRANVLVVGGGCAGLAAATSLAERGAKVRLLEARPVFGGRSRSWIDAVTGDVEDNGQHVIMGCYEQFLAFIDRIGSSGELLFQERLEVPLIEPGGDASLFRPAALPRPFDLLWGLWRLGGFGFRDVAGAAKMMRQLRRGGGHLPAGTAREWLDAGGQSPEARRRFWRPLILATLNLPPEAAPATLLAAVLSQALLGGKQASRFAFPRRGLSRLIVQPALEYLERHGAEAAGGTKVVRLEFGRTGSFLAAIGRGGERHEADALVLAVPHVAAAGLLEGSKAGFGPPQAEALGSSPIIAVHLWFDRRICEQSWAGLLDSEMHWVFDRSVIGEAKGAGYIAMVSSAAGRLARMDKRQLQRFALDELHRFFPLAKRAELRRVRVLKERRATPLFRPETIGLRPTAATGIDNLSLAGDWTATGLPATLEGAASSGHSAAALITG
jgi:squalene-associated FAD-dependent desaturase